jgi:hypothetical protein
MSRIEEDQIKEIAPDHKPCSEIARMEANALHTFNFERLHLYESLNVAEVLMQRDCPICGVLSSLITRHPDFQEDWKYRTLRVYRPGRTVACSIIIHASGAGKYGSGEYTPRARLGTLEPFYLCPLPTSDNYELVSRQTTKDQGRTFLSGRPAVLYNDTSLLDVNKVQAWLQDCTPSHSTCSKSQSQTSPSPYHSGRPKTDF